MSIQERQNQPKSLARLAAVRYLYSRAKRLRNIAIAVVLAVAILGLVASAVDSQYFAHLVSSLVLMSWLLDQCFLSRVRAALAEAARIQEAFDCFVLDLPWPPYRGLHRPTEDRVNQLAAAYNEKNGRPLQDWYPPSAIPDDPILAKLRCQRINCWWEIDLRKKWIDFGCMVFCGFGTILLLLAVSTDLTVAQFVGILAASIRVITWGLNEYNNQTAAINRLRDIHSFAEGVRADQLPSEREIRGVQDAVFDHRRSAPPVPDWFYEWHRRRQESEAGGVGDS